MSQQPPPPWPPGPPPPPPPPLEVPPTPGVLAPPSPDESLPPELNEIEIAPPELNEIAPPASEDIAPPSPPILHAMAQARVSDNGPPSLTASSPPDSIDAAPPGAAEAPPRDVEIPPSRDVELSPPDAGAMASQRPGGPGGPGPGAAGAAGAFDSTRPAPRRRRRGALIAAIVVVVVLLAGGGGTAALLLVRSHSTPTPKTPSASTAPSTSLEPTAAPIANGVAYTDPDKYWSARFDGSPTYHTAQQSTPVGQVPYLYAEFVGPGIDQVVGVLVFSPGTGFDAQKGLQGIADSSGGTVVSSNAATFQGYPSVQGVINLAGNYLKVQLVHVGNLAYIMGTAGAVNPPSDFERFIATVRLAPH